MQLQELYTNHGQLIDGRWCAGGGDVADMTDPATEDLLGHLAQVSRVQVREAIASAY